MDCPYTDSLPISATTGIFGLSGQTRIQELNPDLLFGWQGFSLLDPLLAPPRVYINRKVESKERWNINPGTPVWNFIIPSGIFTAITSAWPLKSFKKVNRIDHTLKCKTQSYRTCRRQHRRTCRWPWVWWLCFKCTTEGIKYKRNNW